MKTKEIVKSQYRAALEMLRQAIVSCPDALWQSPEYKNQFWHIAYHAIFYTDLYLHRTQADYHPWPKHRAKYRSLKGPEGGPQSQHAYSKEEIIEYVGFCLEQMEEQVDALDLKAESGFHWLPFDKLELQFYNIRHLQQHTGELCERLGAKGDVEVDWVGMGPAT